MLNLWYMSQLNKPMHPGSEAQWHYLIFFRVCLPWTWGTRGHCKSTLNKAASGSWEVRTESNQGIVTKEAQVLSKAQYNRLGLAIDLVQPLQGESTGQRALGIEDKASHFIFICSGHRNLQWWSSTEVLDLLYPISTISWLWVPPATHPLDMDSAYSSLV